MNDSQSQPIVVGDMVVHCAHTRIVDINSLIPFPDNENQHTPEQIELLAHIMKQNGVRNSITVSLRSGFITKGHGRLLGAKVNKWTQFPIDEQQYASEALEHVDRVADNKIAELSEIDTERFKATVLKLPEGFDLTLTGVPGLTLDSLSFSELDIETGEAGPGSEPPTNQCPNCGHMLK